MMRFDKFYRELRDLLRVREDKATGIPAGSTLPQPRYSSPGMESIISNASEPISNASDATGVSGESNKEHNTHALANAFLDAVHMILEDYLIAGAWFSPTYEFHPKFVPLGRD